MTDRQRTEKPRPYKWVLAGLLAALGLAGPGCSPAGPDDSKLPPEVQDPKTLRTPQGALELYRAALLVLPGGFDEAMFRGAILTDELAALPVPFGVVASYTGLDSRQGLAAAGELAYGRLHRARAQLREARGFVTAYLMETDTATARDLEGRLYAAEGYADVLLADLFCSGIPLSTVDFDGDYTLAAGSSTNEVYRTAVALFDTALALTSASTGDSGVIFRHLAAVGRGRALLALDSAEQAAAAVAEVPTDFRYTVDVFLWSMWSLVNGAPPANGGIGNYTTTPGFPSVGEREGLNGLPYLSSGANGDPRVGGTLLGPDFYGHDFYFPTKYYPVDVRVTLTLADGIEARLIEAEAALRGHPDDGQWLTTLNTLRAAVGLADTTDPGVGLSDPAAADSVRIDLLFRERAFWLYLTAHREGDLRRLVRQYKRDAETVYPARDYPGGSGSYGTGVVLPVPEAEQQLNPKYSGCFHFGA